MVRKSIDPRIQAPCGQSICSILVEMHDHLVIKEDESLIKCPMIGRRKRYAVAHVIDAARPSLDRQDVGGVD